MPTASLLHVDWRDYRGLFIVQIMPFMKSQHAVQALVGPEVAVMIRRVHSTPRYTADDIDLPFKLPKLLQDENVLFWSSSGYLNVTPL